MPRKGGGRKYPARAGRVRKKMLTITFSQVLTPQERHVIEGLNKPDAEY